MKTQTTQNIAVFGLGSMGYGIASSALKAGHRVYGFDLNKEAVTRFCKEGGRNAPLQEIAASLDVVIIVVLNAQQTESVLFGENGIVEHLSKDSTVIACATVAPSFAKEMEAKCLTHQVRYIDAPISGGSVKAASGELTIMASGKPEAFEHSQPVLDAISQTVFRLGDEAGNGSAMKAANQLLAGVHIATMAEALTFAKTQGIEPAQFLEVISKCAGTSWMLENRAPHIIEGDYTPHSQINIWPKDLGIVLDVAKSAGFSAPITATAMQQYMVAVGMGLGGEDDAAVAKVYARNVGIDLPDKGHK